MKVWSASPVGVGPEFDTFSGALKNSKTKHYALEAVSLVISWLIYTLETIDLPPFNLPSDRNYIVGLTITDLIRHLEEFADPSSDVLCVLSPVSTLAYKFNSFLF